MYTVAAFFGLVASILLYGSLCDLSTEACFRLTFQTIPIVTCLAGSLVLYAWKFLFAERAAKKANVSPEQFVRTSPAVARRVGLSLIVLAAAWLTGSLIRLLLP